VSHPDIRTLRMKLAQAWGAAEDGDQESAEEILRGLRLSTTPLLPDPPTEIPDDGLVFGDLSEITMRPIVFADKPLLQASAFHLLAGRKGVGKGTWLASVAARVTLGELGPNRCVIWIALGEDSYEIDVKPRIVAAGGKPKLVKYLQRGRLRLPDDLQTPLRKAREFGDVGLIIIDPLGGGTGGRNTNKDSEVRPAIDPLNDLAALLDCVVLGVRHITNKKIEGGSLAGILGSSDWVNVPRAVLALVRDNDDDGLRHIQVVAGNRVKGSAGRSFRIVGKAVVDGGEDVTVAVDFGDSAEDVDALLANSNGRPSGIDKQALQQLILANLETGAKSRGYLDELGRDELGATHDQVYRQGIEPLREAKKITPKKDGLSGGWSYELA
jgi:AAA domain